MNEYKNSIKCKYCGHYAPDQCLCYRLQHYDSIKEVSPNSRCKYFKLNDVDRMAKAIMAEKSNVLPRRKDGSYVASLDDVPELRAYYREQEAKAEMERKERKAQTCLLCVGVVLALLFIFALAFNG